MTKDVTKVPAHIYAKAVMVLKMQIKQRTIMLQIDEWLEENGYDVEAMRQRDSFQTLLEHGEFETEEILYATMLEEFKDYAPSLEDGYKQGKE